MNSLPVHLSDASLSYDSFKAALKTRIFTEYQWHQSPAHKGVFIATQLNLT